MGEMILALLAALLPEPRCTHDRCTVTLSSTVATETFKPGTSAAPAYKLVLSDGRTYRDTQPVFTFSVMGPDSLKATAYATTTTGFSRQKSFTILVPAPPPVRMVDTVIVTRVDSIPLLPPGVVIVDPNGAREVHWNNQTLGRLVLTNDNRVQAVRYTPGVMAMTAWPVPYDTQLLAIAALIRGTP